MLYLVATPIGNLADISFHALEILKSVDLVACEDTRETLVLLSYYDIHKPLISFHEHNEERTVKKITDLLKSGKSVAVVADRGTPIISDPGFRLTREAIREDIPFTLIPGPTAFVMALVLSGLPTHSFVFRGFPPHKTGQRQKFLKADKDLPYTLIYYESVHRLVKFLNDALAILGERQAMVAKDLTKKYEAVWRGSLSAIIKDVTAQVTNKGEFTIVIEGLK